jgi:hypothetical protein
VISVKEAVGRGGDRGKGRRVDLWDEEVDGCFVLKSAFGDQSREMNEEDDDAHSKQGWKGNMHSGVEKE